MNADEIYYTNQGFFTQFRVFCCYDFAIDFSNEYRVGLSTKKESKLQKMLLFDVFCNVRLYFSPLGKPADRAIYFCIYFDTFCGGSYYGYLNKRLLL